MDRLAHIKPFVSTPEFRARMAETREVERVKVNRRTAKYCREKRGSDPQFAWACKVRGAVKGALHARGQRRVAQRTTELLGCTPEEFKAHLIGLLRKV